MSPPELDAFTGECLATERTLGDVPAQAWPRPALGEWTLHELAAHLVGGTAKLHEYAARPAEGDAPAHDRVTYWRFDLAAEAPKVAERARARAAELVPDQVPEAFADAWRRSAAAFERVGAEGLVATLRGPMRATEYLATRVLEVCVHHMDVRAALDLPPAATPAASSMTLETLEALLDGPRPRNLGRTRFILTATGRVSSDDPRFPLVR